MNVIFIHSLMFHRRTWERAAERLVRTGIRLHFVHQPSIPKFMEDRGVETFDLLIAELAPGLPGYDRAIEFGADVRRRIGLSPETPADFTTFPEDVTAEFRRYVTGLSLHNCVNGIAFLAAQTGEPVEYAPPEPVLTTGIYHPHAPEPFDDIGAYRAWFSGRLMDPDPPRIGVLFYYSQLMEENTADIDAVIQALESRGLEPLCVFSAGVENPPADEVSGPAWLKLFREEPGVELVLSLMAGRLLKKPDQTFLLEELNVPIIQLLRSHSQSPDQWIEDPQGLPAITAVYSLAQPETGGAIAPTMAAGSSQEGVRADGIGYRPFLPIRDRIEILCRRAERWVRLRRTANRDKRITFVLHNNPCLGVEATVGLAAGLDTFESLARVLQEMKTAGYDVGNAPVNGQDILDEIMNRKAVSEFRWTTVDEIVNKGGVLHKTGREEYRPWFDRLPEKARSKVIEDWDEFPGQGMAYKENGSDVLLITGVEYGNVLIMAQPKRGCYGAKCTGEVCRILHDPELAPPHHWLATYKYIQENSDAVVHFGTEGALEFLPGKQTGLSEACFPEISIGDLPNLYVYVMDATGEGLIAKRRGQAVLSDHLTPVYRPAPMDEKFLRLEDLMEQFQNADRMDETGRKEILGKELAPLLTELHMTETEPSIEELPEIISLCRRRIALAKQSLIPEGLHFLGTAPDAQETGRLLATLLRTPQPGLPDTQTVADWAPDDDIPAYDRAAELLARLAEGRQWDARPQGIEPLKAFCRDAADRLGQCDLEIKHLLDGLEGRYIPPGPSGSLSRGRLDLLPTGRNFFATDVTVLPTRAAWSVGKQMADQLLANYLKDENRFPESIGVSIWSTDAFKSDGELLCQVLYLMGARPVWHPSGRVDEVEAVPLDRLTLELPDGTSLPRPRVDVTIQTSSLMRDLAPNFCELLDRAVVMLSGLDEPEDRNFIRKHTREQMDRLREQTDAGLSDARTRRTATLRIFSSAPGTYGVGVGLALDASAWKDIGDLAEVYVNWGGFAYGYDAGETVPCGMMAHQLLADQLARIDVAYMKQASAEYDMLDCGCYAVCQGGMAAAVQAIGGRAPRLYWGDSTLPDAADVRDLSEEIRKTAMAKLLNPAWFERLKRHGFKGAQAVAGRVNTLYKWSATTNQVPKGLFDAVVETYILNEKNRDWLRQANPYALEEITRRLLEAASRDLWKSDAEFLEAVQSVALEIEGDMEESMGIVTEEFQGGKVEVLTAEDVEKWRFQWRLEDR